MLKKIFYCFIFFCYSDCFSQSKLNINDTVPNISFETFIKKSGNYKSLGDLKGKFIILDFWGLGCMVCISSMPKIDSLQQLFKDNLKILLITKDRKEDIISFFKKRPHLKLPDIDMIVNDSALSALFPYNSLPHHVWINNKGVVEYITDGYNATPENVRSFLNSQKLDFRDKEEYADFDINKPLYLEGNGRLASHILFQSSFLQRIDQYGGSIISYIVDTVNQKIGFRLINQPLSELYKLAFSKSPFGIFYNDNRIILKVADSSRFLYANEDLDNEWMDRNLFSYEVSVPMSQKHKLFEIMQQDINRYLPYEAGIHKKNLECLVLVRNSDKDYIYSKGGKPVYRKVNGILEVRNQTIQNSLFLSLAYALSSHTMPFVDQSNYLKPIDIDLKGDLSNLKNIKSQLTQYGLDIVQKKTDIEMLVIKDRKKATHNRQPY